MSFMFGVLAGLAIAAAAFVWWLSKTLNAALDDFIKAFWG